MRRGRLRAQRVQTRDDKERASTFAEVDTKTSASGHGLQHAGG